MESLQEHTNQYPVHQRIKLSSANIIRAQNKRISGAVNYKRNLFLTLSDDDLKYSPHNQGSVNPHQIYAVTNNNAFQAKAKNVHGTQRIIPECVSLCNLPNNIIINSLAFKEDQLLLTKPLARLLGYELPEHYAKQKFIGSEKAGTVSMDCLSDLARQVYYPPSMSLLLDDFKLHYLIKFRPVDILYQILASDDEVEFQNFFDRYGQGETCGMLLQLICNAGARYYYNTDTERNYQGELPHKQESSQYNETSQYSSYQRPEDRSFKIVELSEELKKRALNLFLKYGNSLSHSEFTDHTKKHAELSLGKFIEPQKRKYTSKLEGIFIYFSRIVRPLWSNYLMNFYVLDGFVPGQISFYKQEDLFILKNRLEEIKEFLVNKGSVLLTQNAAQSQEQGRQSNPFNIEPMSSLQYSSLPPVHLNQLSKDGLGNQARINQELQDILFEDQVTIYTNINLIY